MYIHRRTLPLYSSTYPPCWYTTNGIPPTGIFRLCMYINVSPLGYRQQIGYHNLKIGNYQQIGSSDCVYTSTNSPFIFIDVFPLMVYNKWDTTNKWDLQIVYAHRRKPPGIPPTNWIFRLYTYVLFLYKHRRTPPGGTGWRRHIGCLIFDGSFFRRRAL